MRNKGYESHPEITFRNEFSAILALTAATFGNLSNQQAPVPPLLSRPYRYFD
jgi:hypothetical protein